MNALEATTSGRKIQIGLARSPADERALQLTVEDEGPGIPAELLQEIFQPFFTTRPGGTGLGLAIVARRVEEIGGAVECSSPLSSQGGTRFCVRFRAATGMTASRELSQPKPLVGA